MICIYYDEFSIKDDEFVLKMMSFAGEARGAGEQAAVRPSHGTGGLGLPGEV